MTSPPKPADAAAAPAASCTCPGWLGGAAGHAASFGAKWHRWQEGTSRSPAVAGRNVTGRLCFPGSRMLGLAHGVATGRGSVWRVSPREGDRALLPPTMGTVLRPPLGWQLQGPWDHPGCIPQHWQLETLCTGVSSWQPGPWHRVLSSRQHWPCSFRGSLAAALLRSLGERPQGQLSAMEIASSSITGKASLLLGSLTSADL